MSPPRDAVVLLSGGLDSATTLAVALSRGFRCHTLAVHYGQRHSAELSAASAISRALGAMEPRQTGADLAGGGGAARTGSPIGVPEGGTSGIPVTYVPARHALLLSLALGWAEVLGAHDLFIGVNAVDYSGYPDCRPEFISAFEALARLATRAGVEGQPLRIHAPLQQLSKAAIIQLGVQHGVDLALTVSCYQATPEGLACGRCDSCRLRREGFAAAGLPDSTRYA